MNDKTPSHGGDPCADENLLRAGAIHDANQLLAVIVGRAGLLLRGEPSGDRRRQLEAIEQAARDTAAILARVDRPAAEDAGGGVPARLAAEVRASAALILAGPAGEPDEFVCAVPEDLWTPLSGLVLRETLNNLLLNALEAGARRIVVAPAEGMAAGRQGLAVSDDGPGIPADVVERLFGARAGSKTGGRRGVGLMACRQRLRAAGGDLELTATSPQGTVFTVRLPACAAPDGVTRSSTPPAAAPGARVLVVDDEAAVREMLDDVLGELGARVEAVRDGATARDCFTAGAFDLVVIDRNLPGAPGPDLARDLRSIDPSVAIALISGWTREDELAAADPACVDFTARKPLDWNRMKGLLFEGTELCRRRRRS